METKVPYEELRHIPDMNRQTGRSEITVRGVVAFITSGRSVILVVRNNQVRGAYEKRISELRHANPTNESYGLCTILTLQDVEDGLLRGREIIRTPVIYDHTAVETVLTDSMRLRDKYEKALHWMQDLRERIDRILAVV